MKLQNFVVFSFQIIVNNYHYNIIVIMSYFYMYYIFIYYQMIKIKIKTCNNFVRKIYKTNKTAT